MNKKKFIDVVKKFSMTSEERISKLFDSLEHIRKNNIDGDFVECGVWKGGNIIGVMEYFHYYQIEDKNIWLYDTFEGMSKPEDVDVDLNNVKAQKIIDTISCYSPLDEVKKNLLESKFNHNKLKIVVGDVNETLLSEQNIPTNICVLRLDTDWYSSTKKELEVLYPKLTVNGVLIVDDYGHWKGCKKAVDEYAENLKKFEFEQIDYTGIIHYKI